MRAIYFIGLTGTLAASLLFLQCVGDDPVSTTGSPTDDGGPSTEGGDGSITLGEGGSADSGDGASPLPPLTNAVQVGAGGSHTCALTTTGDVLCWGSNEFGQLGRSDIAGSSKPVKIDLGGAKAAEVAAGGFHSCARMVDGSLRCWGRNERGQLGNNALAATGPVGPVVGPDGGGALARLARLSLGSEHTCAVQTADGGAPAFPTTNPGEFYCWGSNTFREVGVETASAPQRFPIKRTVNAVSGYNIQAGGSFTCAETLVPVGVSLDVTPSCWGIASEGQLGTDAGAFAVSPTAPDDPPGLPYIQVKELMAVGRAHVCVRGPQNAGQVFYCWGANNKGQQGLPDVALKRPDLPLPGVDALNVTVLAAGGDVTCVIESGKVRCVGNNATGQLGNGTIDMSPHPTVTDATLDPTASALSVGGDHVCAVLGQSQGKPGPVMCWGSNSKGQLGDGLDLTTGYTDQGADLKFIRTKPVKVVAP
jgi:hypothetical protein